MHLYDNDTPGRGAVLITWHCNLHHRCLLNYKRFVCTRVHVQRCVSMCVCVVFKKSNMMKLLKPWHTVITNKMEAVFFEE